MYEPKENQVWIEKGESIAPPTSYVRERERERLTEKEIERGRERESAVVVLGIGRHELYMKRVKCSKTLSAFVFHPSEPRTSQKRSRSSRSGIEMLLSLHILHRDQMLVFSGVTTVLLAGWLLCAHDSCCSRPTRDSKSHFLHPSRRCCITSYISAR